MSYSSESVLAPQIRLRDVREFIELLGYIKVGRWNAGILGSADGDTLGDIEEYRYFDEKDYHSWSGIELSIHQRAKGTIVVSTRTSIGRSYYDLTHQNFTISHLKKRFGGTFTTDEGSNRYLRPRSSPPSPDASGCHLAFSRFGTNLIRAAIYQRETSDALSANKNLRSLDIFTDMSPALLSNNLLATYLVTILEEYFKSTFVAILRHSERKSSFFRNIRLQGDQLSRISDGDISLEEMISETLPFQRLCTVFPPIEPDIDTARPDQWDKIYNFDSPSTHTLNIVDLHNLIIHSWIFVEELQEDLTIDGFFVTSDHQRRFGLFGIKLDEFLRVMRYVGQDYPSAAIRRFDPKKNRWVYWQGEALPPE